MVEGYKEEVGVSIDVKFFRGDDIVLFCSKSEGHNNKYGSG